MRLHLVKTKWDDEQFAWGLCKLSANGNYGYLIYGASREECFKRAKEEGLKVVENGIEVNH